MMLNELEKLMNVKRGQETLSKAKQNGAVNICVVYFILVLLHRHRHCYLAEIHSGRLAANRKWLTLDSKEFPLDI